MPKLRYLPFTRATMMFIIDFEKNYPEGYVGPGEGYTLSPGKLATLRRNHFIRAEEQKRGERWKRWTLTEFAHRMIKEYKEGIDLGDGTIMRLGYLEPKVLPAVQPEPKLMLDSGIAEAWAQYSDSGSEEK